MKRRFKAGSVIGKGQRRKTPQPKRRNAPKAASRPNSPSIIDQTEAARIARELNEALQQQAAASEVLQLISSSPDDLQAVFSTILEKAVGICDAKFANIYRWDGSTLTLVATHNTPPAYAEARKRSPVRPHPNNIFGRMLATKAVVHVLDAAQLSKEDPRCVDAASVGGLHGRVTILRRAARASLEINNKY
jgi:hypothetical protein